MTFLSEFFKFENIPIHLKKQINYQEYLNSVYKYLKAFFEKSNPLLDINSILDCIDEEFEENWKEGKVSGWEDFLNQLRNVQQTLDNPTNDENINIDNDNNTAKNNNNSSNNADNPLFCVICQKLFSNPSVFDHHKKGKVHIKNAEKLTAQINKNNGTNANISIENINDLSNSQLKDNNEIREKIKEANLIKEEEVRSLAYFEFNIVKFCQILNDILENTKNTIRKKQSRNYDEIEAEIENEKDLQLNEDDDEEEKPIYNPKNVPLGWDGKPIPYWLYKLHGLGMEFKCEICGGASYWGRRAFERHFQEWRHSYGMKCLKIPNTVHFKEVTGIEDALRRMIYFVLHLFYQFNLF